MNAPQPQDYGYVQVTKRPRKLLGVGLFVLVVGVLALMSNPLLGVFGTVLGAAMIASSIMTGD